MKFIKTDPGFRTKTYGKYREFTRTDFRRVCAYCFRHEGDGGGLGQYEQDHFEPKSRPGINPADYSNLYWSCGDCNGPGCKYETWPSRQEVRYGHVFCDPCKCNPYSRDYKLDKSGVLIALTDAGRYTIEHLRLNKRPYLVEWRRIARELRGRYLSELDRLRRIERRLDAEPHSAEITKLLSQVSRLVEKYEAIAYSQPFVVIPSAVLPQIPDDILRLALDLG
jgi:hypothetical protein